MRYHTFFDKPYPNTPHTLSSLAKEWVADNKERRAQAADLLTFIEFIEYYRPSVRYYISSETADEVEEYFGPIKSNH